MTVKTKASRSSKGDRDRSKVESHAGGASAIRFALGLLAITFAVYASTLSMDFVMWDDGLHVYGNPLIITQSWGHLAEIWRHPYESLYIPVSYSVYSLLAMIAAIHDPSIKLSDVATGFDPHVFHAFNLLLHCANSLLAFLIVNRLVKDARAAFFGALVFAIHPVQVESVAWISEMRGLLSGLFSLLATLTYISFATIEQNNPRRRALSYIGVALLFVLGLLSKPTAVCLPLVLTVIDRWLLKREWRPILTACLPLLAISLFDALATQRFQAHTDNHLAILQRILTAGDAFAFYIQKLLLPFNLGIDYGRNPQRVIAEGWCYWEWLIPTVLAVLVWMNRHKFPELFVASLIFAIYLTPVSGLVPFAFQHYSTVADRYLYMPMLGVGLAVAFGCRLLFASKVQVSSAYAVGGGIAILLACVTLVQERTWQNSRSLMEHGIAVNPNSFAALSNLAVVYANEHDYDRAISESQAVLRLNQNDYNSHLNLGMDYVHVDNLDAALSEEQQAVKLAPIDPIAHFDLAMVYVHRHDDQSAIAEFRNAIENEQGYTLAHYQLALALLRTGDSTGAVNEYQAAIDSNPSYLPAYVDMSIALAKSGDLDKAMSVIQNAIQRGPGYGPAQQVYQQINALWQAKHSGNARQPFAPDLLAGR